LNSERPISDTLPITKRATYSVLVKGPQNEDPRPAGTGFFLTDGGLFATAAHVVENVMPVGLIKESKAGVDPSIAVDPEPVFGDADSDFAILRAKLDDWRQNEYGRIASLRPSDRVLREGDPVYTFGYPLPDPDSVKLTPEQVRALLVDLPRVPELPEIGSNQHWVLANHVLYPRTTSAIISSEIDYSLTLDFEERNEERNHYVVDKAINPGNSGGPLIAPGTGNVHALCTAVQLQTMRQEQYAEAWILIPSSYSYAVRLTHPKVRRALEAHGVEFASD
jgi:S1-C subfamily serine protease